MTRKLAFSIVMALSGVLAVGQQPTLSAGSSQITIVAPVGGSGSSGVEISGPGANAEFATVSVSTQSGGNWLSASVFATQPLQIFPVYATASAATLAVGTYLGQLVISDPGLSPVSVSVMLTVIPPIPLSVSPSALIFDVPASPNPQAIDISGEGPAGTTLSWVATASTASGGGWLSLITPSGTTYPPGSLGQSSVAVNVDPGTLSAGTYTGAVTITAPGASNSPVTVTVTLNIAAVLSVIGISPSTIGAGAPGFTLTVTGTGFVSGDKIQWNGTALATSYISSTQLSATVPSSLIASVGVAYVNVANPVGLGSNSLAFVVGSLTPSLTSLFPSSVTAGGSTFTLTVLGSPFLSGANVLWNGSALATSLQSSSALNATVPANLIASPASVNVTVQNPGGGISNSLPFAVQILTPAVAGLVPSSATAGGPAFTLDVAGLNFVNGANVLWNGSALSTSYSSASGGTGLSATVPASLIASAGSATVRVQDPNGVLSNAQTFAINPATPVLTSTFPAGFSTAGSAGFTLMVSGTGFLNGSRVLWSGTPLVTTYVNGSQLTAAVPTGYVASQGSVIISVQNPNGVTSNALTFTIGPPVPTISSISPSSGTAGGPAFTLRVNGSGFLSGAVVVWNGGPLATTYVSASQLSAAVPASLIASPGGPGVYVLNPGQVNSNSVGFYINSPGNLTIVTPAQLPSGVVGGGYSVNLSATGGHGPYKGWAVVAGSVLPPGISLTPGVVENTAELNGTPTTAGVFTFALEVVDASGSIATEQFTLTIISTIPSNGVANAASYNADWISPGEIVTIFGSFPGPATLVGLELNSQGNVATNLGGSEVTFNGLPAPMIYAKVGQVSCVVPYELSAGSLAQIQVLYLGEASEASQMSVVASVPGVFTADSSGSGQGAILNQDGSVNSASNPAARGSIISLYATGEGQTSPAGVDGQPDPTPAPLPITQPVTARVGAYDATVVYAGGAPGLVAGVFQVNVQIPQGVTPGAAVPIMIMVGQMVSQASVTVAIQ